MVKVNIISGFLGAGKTTLIKKLLADCMKDEKVILLENEYGEVGIDGGFMKDSGIQITELNSGCICCTLVGDFTKAIDELITTYHPDRLIIEPSGVGKLSDIRHVVDEAEKRDDLQLAGCATVVDAGKCKMYMKNFGEFFTDQVRSAETIILSRTQLVSQEKIDQAVALLREQNANARIVTTPWDELSAQTMLDTIQSPQVLIDISEIYQEHHHDDDDDDEDEHEHEHHHDHDDDDEHEHEHHHDHDDHDDDEHEHEHHHHDHDDDDEHEHEHEHHHDHHHHHHHDGEHDADEIFDDIGVETAKKFDEEAVKAALQALDNEELYGTVIRAKGILPTNDGTWLHFDYTPGEWEVRHGSADYTGRLCVIGVGLKEDQLRGLFGV
ncbi:MAG: GTP-binding protein [Clostridia bacterium]|nr:GTP-binding protein [Clostridia bacterium]